MLNSNKTSLIENQEINKITDVIKEVKNSNISPTIDTVKEGSIEKKEFERASSMKKGLANTKKSNPIKISKQRINKKLELEKEVPETEIEVELPEIDDSEIFFYKSLEPFEKILAICCRIKAGSILILT